MSKKPVIDRESCIGCTLCTQIAPNTFKMMDDGKADVIAPFGDGEEQIQQAIDSCPVASIKWIEE